MSSQTYVSMRLRVPEEGDLFLSGKPKSVQIPISKPANCDHCSSICPTEACVESWRTDHFVDLEKTIAGRKFLEILGTSSDKA
jgi:uncharacterized Fe-S center protein